MRAVAGWRCTARSIRLYMIVLNEAMLRGLGSPCIIGMTPSAGWPCITACMAATLVAAISAAAAPSRYTQHPGLNCYQGHGAANIDSGPTPNGGALFTAAQCEAQCDATAGCFCVVTKARDSDAALPHPSATGKKRDAGTTSNSTGLCWRRTYCDPERCEANGQFNAYIKPGAPIPPPTPNPHPLANCSKVAGLTDHRCIFDERHNMRTTDCGDGVSACEGECCAACEGEATCTAWSHVVGFGGASCSLYNGTGATGTLSIGQYPLACPWTDFPMHPV